MTAKDYLLQIGFDEAHLSELFNDDDKSYYKITEIMDAYHESKVKKLPIQRVSNSVCFVPNDIECRFRNRKGECTSLGDCLKANDC